MNIYTIEGGALIIIIMFAVIFMLSIDLKNEKSE
jgi:hypothetical protein